MAISLTHNTNNTTAGGTTCAATLTSVAAGARLIVAITKHTTVAATFDVSDTVNGAWSTTPVVSLLGLGSRRTEIYEFSSSASGSPVVTVTSSASTDFAVSFYAITGSGSVEDTSSIDNVSADPMYAGAATGFNVTAGAFVLAAIAPAGTLGTPVTPDADYTVEIARYTGASPLAFHAYRITSGAITDERCDLDVTTARSGPGATASWPEAAAPATGTSNLLLLGVG